jgi:membrane fusion protein, multidrug efflux system
MRVLAFFMVVGLSACSVSTSDEGATPGGDEEKPVLDPRILVESVEAVVGAVGDNVVASASVESEGQAVLIPEASGLVTGVYAEEGDRVVRGQLLAEIASPALDGAYARAAEELARAEGDAASAERLFAQGALSRSELEAAQRAHTAARTVHAEARQTRGFTRLESPINGVVASRQIRYGETAGPTPAFTVVDLDRLRVVVALPERDLARVRPGQPATIVSAYDDAVAGSGQVLRVAPVVDTATGTVRVTVGLDPGQVQLRPGQFVNVQIEVARHESVVTVPRRAIVWEEGKSYVFTLLEGPPPPEPGAEPADGEKKAAGEEPAEGAAQTGGLWAQLFGGEADEESKEPEIPGPWRRAHRIPVTLGFEDGTLAEVTEGLNVGAPVVTIGNDALRDDARVRLPGDPAMPKPEPASPGN